MRGSLAGAVLPPAQNRAVCDGLQQGHTDCEVRVRETGMITIMGDGIITETVTPL